MASCRHVEIWKTQSSSSKPARSADVRTDHKFIRMHAEEDGSVYRLKESPGLKDGSLSASGLPDSELRQMKPRTLEADLLQVYLPEEERTSGNNGVSSDCSDRRRIANVYVDSPSPPAVTRTECDVSTGADDVKSTSSEHPADAGDQSAATDGSIICERCGGCRCERCGSGGRQLPGVWCGSRCGYCTPSRVVDVLSCVSCVRAVVYHCSVDDDTCKPDQHDVVDDDVDACPCTCSGSASQCRRRWACLTALTGLGCLPCLLLYWPLRALLAAGRAVYSAAGRRRGCRCGHSKKTARARLLLADTESSST